MNLTTRAIKPCTKRTGRVLNGPALAFAVAISTQTPASAGTVSPPPPSTFTSSVTTSGNGDVSGRSDLVRAPGVGKAALIPPKNIFTLNIITTGNDGFTGHSYLMLTNLSPGTIKVFGFGVKKGKVVTVGTFGNKREGKGAYLSLEAHKQLTGARASLAMNITQSQFATLAKWVKSHNSWSCPANCSTFASDAWSLLAPDDKDLNAGFPSTPTNLKNDLKNKTGYATGIKVPKRAASAVKRLMPNGTLKQPAPPRSEGRAAKVPAVDSQAAPGRI